VGDLERVGLEQLERQLLRQHHVAGHQVALRVEAPAAHAPAGAVELLDIHLPAMANAVALAGAAADHIEETVLLVLQPLGGSEVLLEQSDAALLGALAADVAERQPGTEEAVAGRIVALLRPPLEQPSLRLLAARERRLRLGSGPPAETAAPDAVEQSRHTAALACPTELVPVLGAHARIHVVCLPQQGPAEVCQVPCRVVLAEAVEGLRPHGRPEAIAAGEMQ